MMACPANYRSQDNSLIGKWSVWIIAGCVTQFMCISGGIRKKLIL